MMEAEVRQLKHAVERAHCAATFVRSVPIREDIPGGVWEGTVYVFDLAGNPTANRAWAAPIAGSGERRTLCRTASSAGRWAASCGS
jgi:hypothetical protein